MTETAPRRRMLRYEVGIDGWTTHGMTGEPVHVGALGYGSGVEFWAEHDEAKLPRERTFQVFGTGHVLPPGARRAGTAPRTREGLVWHLFEFPAGIEGG
ncbi:MAG TPA: hypothetical protein VK586_15840 [Streptosporangiaceae bacterium]|nr:hypothetical protein [Streptosporangiaceae bacterium]